MSPALSPRKHACDHVYRKFPVLKGTRPKMKKAGDNRIFTFEKTVRAEGGPALKQIVKVTVNPAGQILKVVASR